MPRRERPYLVLQQNQFRESYELHVNDFIRGSKVIQLYNQENLKFVKSLGSGSSGYVSLYYDTVLKKNVAVKSILIATKSNRDQIFHEEDCFKSAKEKKYVVQKLGYFLSDGYINIVLEYMDEGSLDKHYNKENPIPDRVLRCIAWQLLEALIELKSVNITHRDIKPENILLHSDGSVKFSDFGISKVIDPSDNSRTFVGTLRYMSPERLKSESYTYRCDYWSTAIVLLEAALGYYPLGSNVSQIDLESKINEHQFEDLYAMINEDLAYFLKDWLREERLRTVPEIKIKDPYLTVDGKAITREKSMQIIAEWLQEQHSHT